MSSPPLSEYMPEPKTDAARVAREVFLAEFTRQVDRAKQVALSILVWGPSPDAQTPAARKRIEIGQFLVNDGHNAMFSEQLIDVPMHGEFSAKAREYFQAKVVHLIFILIEGSPGALAEAIDFICLPQIAPKCVVFVPEEYKFGYAAAGAIKEHEHAYRGVFWYKPKDLAECHVLGEVRQRTQARRLQLLRLKEALNV